MTTPTLPRSRESFPKPIELLEPRIAPATFIVTNLTDADPGSLRDAIAKSELTPAKDTILFKAGLAGTIVLTSGELAVTKPLTITGPGAAKIIISGNDASRIFNVDDGDGAKDSPFTLSGLALIKGNVAGGPGGAISSQESLTVKNSILSLNTAARGGAIFVDDHPLNKVLLSGSTISGNSATSSWGGGLYLDTGKGVTILNSSIIGNSAVAGGGGAYFGLGSTSDTKAKIAVTGSVFRNNFAISGGGGIAANLSDRAILLSKTEVSGNTSAAFGGGLYLIKTAFSMTGGTIAGNGSTAVSDGGGGAYIFQSVAKFAGTRIIGNTSGEDGGGIVFDPNGNNTKTLTLIGGTVSGNSAAQDGGGIFGFSGGKVIAKGTSFLSNRAVGEGGGISTFNGTSLEISGGVYEDNRANAGGAVDTAGSGTVVIKAAKFFGNRATGADGGALYLRTNSTAVIMSSLFNGNSAADDAGAICLGGTGTFTLTGVTVLNSIAADYGGGITVLGQSTTISKSLIKSNYAGHIGGGISNFGSLTIKTSVITGNIAKTNGGGLYDGTIGDPVLTSTKIFGNVAPVNPDKNF